MSFHYYPETDSLYIDLADRAGAESKEVAPGVVLDFDLSLLAKLGRRPGA